MPDWKAMLGAVRADCSAAVWSKGVALARGGAVAPQARRGDEWSFRVRLPRGEVAPTVALLPEEGEWECDCEGLEDPCEHVAACAIASAQAGGEVEAWFGGAGGGDVLVYEIDRTPGGVRVERRLRSGDGTERRIAGSLGDLLAGDGRPACFEPTQQDLEIDVVLRAGEPIEAERVPALLAALAGVEPLLLDGRDVRASVEPLVPRARVVDAKGGAVELVIEPDSAVSEIVAPGMARAGDRLHPMGASAPFGSSWERLPIRRRVEPDAFGELVGRLLPEIERHVPVEVETSRLPARRGRLVPWLQFDLEVGRGGVDVMACLVYGDPPLARIEDGRIVPLGGAVPQRDERAERRLVARLRDELNLVPGRRVRFSAEDGARLVSRLRTFDDGRPVSARGGRRDHEHPDLAPRLRPAAGGGGYDLVFETVGRGGGGAGGEASAEAVLTAWRQGISLVPLVGGGLAQVPQGWLERHGEAVEDLLAARAEGEAGAAGRALAASLPILHELCDALDTPPPLEVQRLRALLDGPASRGADRPEGFRGRLRPYQEAGVAWLGRLREAGFGAVLADDMGLGKTIQALCVVRGRTLVVCPRSVIHNWASEARRFRPDLRVVLHHGRRRELTEADLTLTTYATLRNDAALLAGVAWDAVVLDEAQAIKNPDSQTARAAYALPAAFRLSLSGTPVENRLDELWSQMRFANPGLFGSRADFAERYEKPILAGDGAAAARLRARLRPFVLRRLKREVAPELPPRTESVIYCELEEGERALYDAVRVAARADLVRRLGEGASALAALEALLRLRQAACHPGLLPGRHAEGSSKVEALCEALEDAVADGHKTLVFSQWTSFLDLIEPHLARRSIDHLRLDGATRDRAAVVSGFQSPEGPPVLLISLTAGGTGLNLTAADHVFLLDPWWNPAVEQQAADRVHRIGQDRPVFVYRLVAKDTVEERVLALQERKRALAESALGGAREAAGGLTREEILALLDD